MTERKPYRAFLEKPKHGGLYSKLFMVFLCSNVSTQGKQPDEFLLDIKLTREAAQRVCDQNPGAYIVRGFATKN